MKRKRKSFFLPIILASSLLLGACNEAPVEPEPPEVVTFTVSFDANGGSGYMDNVTGLDGEYTLPECSFTAPAGKHFAGWKVNNQGELLQPGATITVSANTQIVAIWEITTYTVSFPRLPHRAEDWTVRSFPKALPGTLPTRPSWPASCLVAASLRSSRRG